MSSLLRIKREESRSRAPSENSSVCSKLILKEKVRYNVVDRGSGPVKVTIENGALRENESYEFRKIDLSTFPNFNRTFFLKQNVYGLHHLWSNTFIFQYSVFRESFKRCYTEPRLKVFLTELFGIVIGFDAEFKKFENEHFIWVVEVRYEKVMEKFFDAINAFCILILSKPSTHKITYFSISLKMKFARDVKGLLKSLNKYIRD